VQRRQLQAHGVHEVNPSLAAATRASADLQAGLQVGHAGQLGRPDRALARDRIHLLRAMQTRVSLPLNH